MIVDESQSLIDDVHDVVEIDEKQRLRTHSLDGEIDSTDQNVGSRIDANEVRHARVKVQLGGNAVDFQKDSLDAQIRNVEHDVVLWKFMGASRAARNLLRSGHGAAGSSLSRQTIHAKRSVESTRRISRLTLPRLS